MDCPLGRGQQDVMPSGNGAETRLTNTIACRLRWGRMHAPDPLGPKLVCGAHLRFSTLACCTSSRVLFRCTSPRLLVHRRPRARLLGFRGLVMLLASVFCRRRAGPRHGRAQGRGSRPCHARVGIPLGCRRLCRPLPRLRCAPGPLGRLGGWEWIGRMRALACCAARFRHRGWRRPLLIEPCLHPNND